MLATQRRVGWQEYDAIQSVVDGVDEVARQQEQKWGVGRLELLVSDEFREKFRRQLRRFNDAITECDVEKVRQAGAGMKRGWLALDQAAEQAGETKLDPDVWEIKLSDGSVMALCRTKSDAYAVTRSGRRMDVWTPEEIARVVESFPEIAVAKQTFPGAYINEARPKRAVNPHVVPFVDDDVVDLYQDAGATP